MSLLLVLLLFVRARRPRAVVLVPLAGRRPVAAQRRGVDPTLVNLPVLALTCLAYAVRLVVLHRRTAAPTDQQAVVDGEITRCG